MPTTESLELSRREREIALAYAEGANHREIATRLFIAPATVRTHLGTIYRKLGVSSKIALLRALNPPAATPPQAGSVAIGASRRASLAVMPFRSDGPGSDGTADGLARDIITRLAKLRSVRVSGRGSVFALSERGVTDEEAGRLLNVDYLATGSVRRSGQRITITIELIEMQNAEIIWAETYVREAADVLGALDEIGDRIVVSMASEVEASERNRAILKHPQSLGAWESYHRGLWHMYRFTGGDNERAQDLFRRAVDMDPTFARAWAGLSFTHFQNAFLIRPGDRAREADLALETAGSSLEADERDPAAHWAMGRALWLRGAGDRAISELETSVDLSPNFTRGHYAVSFVNSQAGNALAAIEAADRARELSPFDPLLFGFLGARAMAFFRLGAFEEAADCAVQAAERPNAHIHIWMIAALCLAAAGRTDEAQACAGRIGRRQPTYGVADFLSAFNFAPETRALYIESARRVGIK